MVTKNKTNITRIYLNQTEIITLNDFLRTICSSKEVGGQMEAEYKAPWNDTLVVNELKAKIPHLAVSHVSGLRTRVFGEISRGGPKHSSLKQLADRIEKLEEWARSCGFEDTNKP